MQKGILLLTIFLGMTLSLQAQEVEKITLQEAIEISLENNYQLKQARNNLDLAEERELSAKGDFLPSINGSLNAGRREGSQFIPGTDNFVNTVSKSISGSVNMGLPIFAGFENINNLRSSQYNKRSEEENLQRVRETVIFQTASNYLQVILDKELLEIDRENLAASQQTLEQVKAQVEVGSRPTVDLYNQEATVANNELQVVNSENALNASKLQLIRQLQVDPLQQYEFSTPEVNPQNVNAQDYNLRQLVNTAMDNRSDLRSDQLGIQSLEHQLSVAKASLYPSLSLNAQISSDYSDRIDFDFSDQFYDQNVVKFIGLSLNVPIFNNFNRRANIQSQMVTYKNAKLNLENTELQVVQDVNQAYNDYQSYVKQLESSRKALTAAEKTYETQQERYQVGAGTLIELSDANAQFVQAQANTTQALFRVIFQQKLLDYYIGRLDQDIELN
ncbi:MAG TPA: TolC family protein [Halalkalibaculum sp.]|nr:TolC family protein [Halalkalibaculum sp.]